MATPTIDGGKMNSDATPMKTPAADIAFICHFVFVCWVLIAD